MKMTDSNTPLSQPEQSLTKFKGSFTDHLANERTFLAWTRTSLGIYAFGCAITRFGGIEKIPIASKNSSRDPKPLISGLVLVACGIITLLYSIYRYYRINRQIIERDLTEVSQIREPIGASLVLLLSLIGILVIFIIL
ncbi:hypothetical protein I4U23_029242 [Adineta vaga]|nr:hypothetical protein I4U23_029242 [Adineta vaga]